MRRLRRIASALLVALWALCVLLTVSSFDRDIVESPIRVHGAANVDDYPVVSSFHPWAVRDGDPAAEVQVGDRLLQIGDEDARGVSGPRAVSFVWAEMDMEGVIRFLVERDGERLSVTGRLPAPVSKWPGVILSLVYGGLAVGALRRFPDLRVVQVAFPALMASALFFGARFGTTPNELLAAFWIQAGSLLVLQPLNVRLIRHFPDGSPGARWAIGWPWLLGLNGIILVDAMFFDLGPPALTDYGNKAITLAAPLVTLAVGIDRYVASNRTNRRRFKWLLFGVILSQIPGAAVGLISSVSPALGQYFMPSQLAGLAVPLCLWIAITRHNLFDIDRLLNGAAVVFAAILAVGGLLVGVGPSAHAWLVDGVGVSDATAGVVVAFGLLAGVGAAALQGRAWLDRWTLGRRREREAGVERLLTALDQAEKLREIGARVTQDLVSIWNARGAAVFVRMEQGLSPVSRTGELPREVDPERATSIEAVRREGVVNDAGILRDVQRPLVARIGGGGELDGAIVLAPERSGDPYEESDRALLAVVAERVSARLAALEHRELLDHARALNRELTASKERAEAESAEKTAMLASATHDLRQPLQALRLFLGTLGERMGDAEDVRLVEKAQLSAIAMQQQFEGLLDESRLDAGTVRAQLQPVPLDELFSDIHDFLSPLAAEKGLALETNGHGLAVRSDPSLLRSIVQNLVGNAIRYTERGQVRVDARSGDGGVTLEVADTGRGMDESELEALFEAGRRGRSAQGESRGAGLGLSIVARLCDLLGHVIRVRSKPGAGSTISLRAEAAPLARADVVRTAGGADLLAEARIVVIDDDADTRAAIARLVRGWGADVAEGASAREVIEGAPGFAPDAALLDYTLEATTGLEALAELEATWGPMPAAVLTGETGAEVTARVRERGLPLLRKPAAPVQIRAVLTSLVS